MRGFVIGLLAAMAAATLSACATVQKLDAASDVHALLVSIRDNDRATFETLVDRRALKREIEARLVAEARRRTATRCGAGRPPGPGPGRTGRRGPDPARGVPAGAEHYGYTPRPRSPAVVAISSRCGR